MGNPRPKHPRDYRDIEGPRLMTRDVLIWLVYEYQGDDFTVRDISPEFNISLIEANTRLSLLKKWGCIRIESRTDPVDKRKRFLYSITAWGHEMAEKWRGERNGKKEFFPPYEREHSR